MKEKKFNFVYLTTNLVNGKRYVGDHSTDNLECKHTRNYLGSGKTILWPAIKKYGKKNFKREILEFFPTKQEAFDAQEKYIKQFNTLTPNGYNISPRGGCMCGLNCHSEETKARFKNRIPWNKGKKGIPEKTKLKLSLALKGRKLSKETKEKISISKLKLEKHHTEEAKIKMSNSHIGKKHSQETKDKIKSSVIKSYKSSYIKVSPE